MTEIILACLACLGIGYLIGSFIEWNDRRNIEELHIVQLRQLQENHRVEISSLRAMIINLREHIAENRGQL